MKFEKDQAEFERGLAQQGGQHDQPHVMEEDQAPPVPQMMQQQGLPPYFAEYTYAMANWAQEISARDRMPPPAFPEPFLLEAARYRQDPYARTNAFERFASPQDMEDYFTAERQRGLDSEERIRQEYYRIQAEHQSAAGTYPQFYQFPPSGPGGSSGGPQ